ncbi:MAG: hypothetical protein R3178_08155 [Rhodothermales bacterium]|nr:hypothetical protein [Rhodothermales bacterium]
MNWVKTTVVDIAVTVCIVVAVFMGEEWARWVIWVYTPFILLLKVGALFASPVVKRTAGKKQQEEAPEWFYHVVYAVSAGLLAYAGWWWLVAGWLAIWSVSSVAARRK